MAKNMHKLLISVEATEPEVSEVAGGSLFKKVTGEKGKDLGYWYPSAEACEKGRAAVMEAFPEAACTVEAPPVEAAPAELSADEEAARQANEEAGNDAAKEHESATRNKKKAKKKGK